MIKIKKPGIGFMLLGVALIFAIVAFAMYFSTYDVGGYTINRWAAMYTALSLWCLVFLEVNILFFGDKPFWTYIIYALTAFMLVYSLLLLIQPCLTPIGFVFGAGDLNMGDSALNEVVANKSIVTAVFYVLAAFYTIAAAFMPAEWPYGKQEKAYKAAEITDVAQAQEATEIAEAGNEQ